MGGVQGTAPTASAGRGAMKEAQRPAGKSGAKCRAKCRNLWRVRCRLQNRNPLRPNASADHCIGASKRKNRRLAKRAAAKKRN